MTNPTTPRIAAGMSVDYLSQSGRVYRATVVQAYDLYRAIISVPDMGEGATLVVAYSRLTPTRYAIRHTFPDGRTLENYPYLTVPGRPQLVLTGTLEDSEHTAAACRANNPGHTFTVEPY